MASDNQPGSKMSDKESMTVLLNTIGALFVASFFGTILYGLMLHQAHRYFCSHRKDIIFIKLVVTIVMVIETAYTALNVHIIYTDFVTHYGELSAGATKLLWSSNMLPLLGVIASTVNHLFVIRRVYMVGSRYSFLSFVAAGFHTLQTAFGLAITIKGFIEGTNDVYTKERWMVGLCFGSATLADLAILIALLGAKLQQRMNHRRPEIPSIMDMTSIYVINSGALVLVLDALTFTMAIGTTGNLYWAAINSVTSRVYTNTLLNVLNSRTAQRSQDVELLNEGPLRTFSHAHRLAEIERWNIPEDPEPFPPKITINVTTEKDDGDMSRIDSEQISDHGHTVKASTM